MAEGEHYKYTRAFSYLSKVSNEKKIQTKEIKKIIKKHKSKNYFLDIGAGSGDIFFEINNNFKESIAIEPGERMFEILKSRTNKSELLLNCTWENFYSNNYKKYQNHFDLITNVHTIYFIKEPIKEIKNMLKLLNKDGILVLIYGYIDNPREDFFSKFKHDFLGKNYFTNETYESINTNFKNIETHFMHTTITLQDFKDLEENHLSEKSAPTNYFLKFSIKKWYDELTSEEKKSLLKYLNPLKKKDKYLISNKQVIQVLRK
jgi:SAM-dependent methyltransferase